eukprot:6390186-Pyramimonas_sp.AAC.1
MTPRPSKSLALPMPLGPSVTESKSIHLRSPLRIWLMIFSRRRTALSLLGCLPRPGLIHLLLLLIGLTTPPSG